MLLRACLGVTASFATWSTLLLAFSAPGLAQTGGQSAAPSFGRSQPQPNASPRSDQPDPNNLDSILSRLDANLHDYETLVPSFFCKEHAISDVQYGSEMSTHHRTVADSTFRIRRDPEQPAQLQESRTVNTLAGKAQPGDSARIDSPLAVFGIFSGALRLLSTSSQACFQYRLHQSRKGRPPDPPAPIVVVLSSLSAANRGPGCQYTEKTSGRALVDPVSMHIVHIETRTRDHEITSGVRGDWDWSVDYAPVTLNNRIFWLPSAIRSTAVAEPAGADLAGTSAGASNSPARGTAGYNNNAAGGATSSQSAPTYHLLETFGDYHLLTAESRIIPAPPEPGASSRPDQ